jgi:hypothetical protein
MQTRAYITILLMALLVSGIIHIAVAQNIAAGVKPGDSFTYGVTGTYPAEIATSYIPQEVLSAQATQYFKVTILSVTGPEIGYAWSWHFNNGSDPLDGNSTLNIETAQNTGPFWPIVSANLTVGKPIHPHLAFDTSTFNETVNYAYSNYTRVTNRLETSSVETNNVTTREVNSDSYFDKLTGMLVKLNDVTDYSDPTFETTLTWELLGQTAWTSSSAGSSPPAPFFSLPVIIAIAVVVAIVVVIGGWFVANKRRNARRKQLLRKK